MKWEPAEIIRLVALVGALVLFALGALMMWQGITAEGAIDIKSSVISGSLKTGSAGLFIVFLAFVLIVFVLSSLTKKHPITAEPISKNRSKTKGLAVGFFVLLTSFILSASLAALGYGVGFGILAAALGFFALVAGIALLTFMEEK